MRDILFKSKEIIKRLKNEPVITSLYQLSQKYNEEIFLVGGCVRDFLLGSEMLRDFDFVLGNLPFKLAQELADKLQGSMIVLSEEFGQYRVVFHRLDRILTIDFSKYKGSCIEEDLRKRDFTINSLAIDLSTLFKKEELKIVDPVGGINDLQSRILKLSSKEALNEDPLRILRGIRIACEYQFYIDPSLSRDICDKRELLAKVASERIKSELIRIFEAQGIADSLILMDNLGILSILIPEVNTYHGFEQGERHREDLWTHSIKTAQRVEELLKSLEKQWPEYGALFQKHFSEWMGGEIKRSTLLKLAGFLHDIGKPGTRSIDNKGRIKFYGHDNLGAKIILDVSKRFRFGYKTQKYLETVISNHMRIINLANTSSILTQRAKYRFCRDLGDNLLDLCLLTLADVESTDYLINFSEEFKKLRDNCDNLIKYYFNDYTKIPEKPLLSGNDIMKIFGIPEGKQIGVLIKLVKEAEVQGLIHTREDAINFLKERFHANKNRVNPVSI